MADNGIIFYDPSGQEYDLGRIVELPDLSQARTPESAAFTTMWQDKRGDRTWPRWRDFDWLEMPMDVVPRLMVVDVVRDPLDFRYRYFGTWHARCHKRDMTGQFVSAYPDINYRTGIHSEYADILTRRGPQLSWLELTLHHIPYLCEILRLPLSDDDAEIDRIMVVETVFKDEVRAGSG